MVINNKINNQAKISIIKIINKIIQTKVKITMIINNIKILINI